MSYEELIKDIRESATELNRKIKIASDAGVKTRLFLDGDFQYVMNAQCTVTIKATGHSSPSPKPPKV